MNEQMGIPHKHKHCSKHAPRVGRSQ